MAPYSSHRTLVQARSYIQDGTEFTPVEDFQGVVTDKDYVTGAIELTVCGKKLISLKMWDLVDQLWAYLVNGLAALDRGDPFEIYFPDQPIFIKMVPKSSGKVEFSIAAHEKRSVEVDSRLFVQEMAYAATLFFEELNRIQPSSKGSYADTLGQLKRLSSQASSPN